MADPKYANLPGIAPPDEKDLYETDDLPEADQDLPLDEAESDCIDRPHINSKSAHERFRGKRLIPTKDLDFSDAARRRPHTGYLAISGDWEIAAEGEPETLLQRRNRLQAEFRLLIDDLNKVKDSKEAAKDDAALAVTLVPDLEASLQQLGSMAVPEGTQLAATPSHHIQNIQKMVNELNENEKKKAKSASSGEPVLTYALHSFPAHVQLAKSARIAELELRLKDLETTLGSTPDNLHRLKISDLKSIGDGVHDLTARVNLLNLNAIDSIDSKLAGLLSKMDSAVEKRGGQQQVELETKVNELYESYRKVDALSQSLLPVADRLSALTTLNQDAAEFKKTLVQLKAEMKVMTNKIAADEASTSSMRDEMHGILTTVTASIENFNKRLQALQK